MLFESDTSIRIPTMLVMVAQAGSHKSEYVPGI
jgi:hypothetical protein